MIDLTSLVGDLRVPLCACGINDEVIGVAFVVKRIENNLEGVARIDAKVFLQLRNDDAAGLRIIRNNTEIKVLGIVQNRNFGSLGSGFTFLRLPLRKCRGSNRVVPGGLVQSAIDRNFLGDLEGVHPAVGPNGFIVEVFSIQDRNKTQKSRINQHTSTKAR